MGARRSALLGLPCGLPGLASRCQTEEDVAAASSAGGGVSYELLEATARQLGQTARLDATPHLLRTLSLHEFGNEVEGVAAAAAGLLPSLTSARR